MRVAVAVMDAGLVGPALALPSSAHNGHGAKSCSSSSHVVTSSKSAGQTWHIQDRGYGNLWRDFGYVSPSAPYRHWHAPQNVDGWGVTAPVLESHSASCSPDPI